MTPKAPKVQQAHHQPQKCLYCGTLTDSQAYIVNPKASSGRELPCCSQQCLERTKTFVAWDNKTRTLLYLLLFVMVVANLLCFGMSLDSRWQYLPMLGIGVCVLWVPSVFTRYERYQALGIGKTRVVIRVLAAALAAFSAMLIATY